MHGLILAGLAVAAVGCAPAAGAGLGLLVVLVFGAVALVRSAGAGAPVPCDGDESTYCEGGHVRRRCCPKNAKCNYRSAPFIACGQGTCAAGGDRGRCPAPEPVVGPARSESACTGQGSHGSWELACVEHRVARVCIPPVPTNFSGPARNPPYRTCGGERCTTHTLIEDCLPENKPGVRCDGQWRKVCFGGKLGERCVPRQLHEALSAAGYVTCPDGSCAVGSDRAACP